MNLKSILLEALQQALLQSGEFGPDRKPAREKGDDINLPDDKKGKIVGWSKTLRPMQRSDFPEETLTPYQRRVMKITKIADPILGGDSDDPRWDRFHSEISSKPSGRNK